MIAGRTGVIAREVARRWRVGSGDRVASARESHALRGRSVSTGEIDRRAAGQSKCARNCARTRGSEDDDNDSLRVTSDESSAIVARGARRRSRRRRVIPARRQER